MISTTHTNPTAALDPLRDSVETARQLGLTGGAPVMAEWRRKGRYPDLRYIRIGRTIRYRQSDIDKFIAAHSVGGL